ncbi:MAG: beta-propeller fold lactonase family protein, partial [Nitrospira sp.]|nr:beta-propeller fold lactonase family protein [Nitrospira sp.]
MKDLHWMVSLTLPMVFALSGCPDGGGGNGGFEATGSIPNVVYTANGGSNTLSGFTIGTAGALTVTTPAIFSTSGSNNEWVAVSPNGQFLYSSNQNSTNVSGFTVNSATGNLTPTAPATFSTGAGSSPRGITVTRDNQLVYVANSASNTVSGFSI